MPPRSPPTGNRWLVGLVALGCACGSSKFSLLPPITTQSARDPDLTRPLVEIPPPSEAPASRPAAGSVGPIGAAVTGAAVLAWLLGSAAPLVGIYGTFDENTLVQPQPQEPRPR